MKRVSVGLAAVLLAVLLCCPAARAEEYGYYVSEADATIALPSWEEYYYLYPRMAENNEDLISLGITPEDVDELLAANGILFGALHHDASHEIAVQVIEGSGETLDYSCLSEAERAEVARAILAELEQSGCTVQATEWLEGGNAVWLVTELSLTDGSWLYQCHTYFGSAALSFTASTATGVQLTDAIRQTTTDMALGTVFQEYRPAQNADPEDVDVEALAAALGLTTQELEALLQGELEFSALDLSRIDLEKVFLALGISEAELFEEIRQEPGLEHLDLSMLHLSEVDLEALVTAFGLTDEEFFALLNSELAFDDLDLSRVDFSAVLDALGLTLSELIALILSGVGQGGVDWMGLLRSMGRGALTGLGLGAAAVVLILVLLAVTGRKKRAAGEPGEDGE